MNTNGRELIVEACAALNEAKVLPYPITVTGVDTATGDELDNIVNKFLDDVETVPEAKEHAVPKKVIEAYNAIVDDAVVFAVPKKVTAQKINVRDIEYRRTKF